MKITRRKFLRESAALVGSGLAGTLAQPLAQAKAAPAPATSLNDVQHVVIFMNENRSFDHYFGTLSGVRGFSDPAALRLANGKSVFYQPAPQNRDGYVLPFRLDTTRTNGQCLADENHSWS